MVHEPGHEIVAAEIDGSVLGAANLGEVVGKLVDASESGPIGVVESAVPGLQEKSPSPRRHPHQQFKKAARVDLGKTATVVAGPGRAQQATPPDQPSSRIMILGKPC